MSGLTALEILCLLPFSQHNDALPVQQNAAYGRPSLMGIPAELRRLILRNLLTVNQDPTFAGPKPLNAAWQANLLSRNKACREGSQHIKERFDGILQLRIAKRARPIDDDMLQPAIMRVNRQIHTEAAEVLHSNRFVGVMTNIDLGEQLRKRRGVPVWESKLPMRSARPLLTFYVKRPIPEPRATCKMTRHYLLHIKDISRLAEVLMSRYSHYPVEVAVVKDRLPALMSGVRSLDLLVKGPLLPWISGMVTRVTHLSSFPRSFDWPMSDIEGTRLPMQQIVDLDNSLREIYRQCSDERWNCDLLLAEVIWSRWLEDLLHLRDTGSWRRQNSMVLNSAFLFNKIAILIQSTLFTNSEDAFLHDYKTVAMFLIASVEARTFLPRSELRFCGSTSVELIWQSIQYLESVVEEVLHFGNHDSWKPRVQMELVLCWARLGHFKQARKIIHQILLALTPDDLSQTREYYAWRGRFKAVVKTGRAASAVGADGMRGMMSRRSFFYQRLVHALLEPRWKVRFGDDAVQVPSLAWFVANIPD